MPLEGKSRRPFWAREFTLYEASPLHNSAICENNDYFRDCKFNPRNMKIMIQDGSPSLHFALLNLAGKEVF